MASSKGKQTAIQSSASDISRLLIDRSSTSTRDLSDEEHQALDKEVLGSLQAFIQHGWTPNLDTLLFHVVNNDKRLKRLSATETKILLERESSLTPLLQKAWDDCSFKEIRLLGMSPCFPSEYRH
jgi:hypothetical protein